jgi:trehalose 6-phosphate synthase
MDRESDVRHKCAGLFGGKRLVIVSNRGPLEYEMEDGQKPTYRIGSGGLVTALLAGARLADVTWVAAALTEADRYVASSGGSAPQDSRAVGCQVRFVVPDRRAYHLHYNVFSNPILWFLHHSMLDSLDRRDLWDQM